MSNNKMLNLCQPLAERDNSCDEDERRRRLAQRGYVGVTRGTNKVRFATVGDVHGHFAILSKKLQDICSEVEIPCLDFILQVGDIECHRNQEDLRSMAAPSAKRSLGDFGSACHLQQDYLPHPMYFIGGNHECYGWLDSEDHFTMTDSNTDPDDTLHQVQAFLEVAPNVFYLGRAGYLPLRFFENQAPLKADVSAETQQEHEMNILGVLHLGFLSGVHRPSEYFYRRPAMTSGKLDTESNKRWIGFNIYDTQLLLQDDIDDGIFHSKSSHQMLGSDDDFSLSSCEDPSSGRQKLTFLLANLLGVSVGESVGDASIDIRLSKADVQFLTRFLIPYSPNESRETIAKRRRNAVDKLPLNLNGIVSILLEKRSKEGVEKLLNRLQRKRAVDIFLTHDWPAGVVEQEELYGSSENRRSRPVGNSICRELLEGLKPLVHCCGHMHYGYRQQIKHKTPSGKPSEKRTELCCLGKVGYSGSAAFAVFELDLVTGDIVEINRDPRLSRLGPFEDMDQEDD